MIIRSNREASGCGGSRCRINPCNRDYFVCCMAAEGNGLAGMKQHLDRIHLGGMILAIDLKLIPLDTLSMDELAQRADMQLNVIENAYSIRIKNKEEIVGLLSKGLQDKRQIFLVCTSISSWIAGSNIRGDTVVPINIVLQLIEAASHSS